MNRLGDCRRPEEGGGEYCSADNELPKSEETASAAVARNFSCQSLERETDRKTDRRKDAFDAFVYPESGRYKLRLGQRKSRKHVVYETCDLYRKMKVV